ncbi:MAG: alpha/beta hydrolase [Cellvibrionales bacterium]|nr:alpha/beta hydrolase [Cellvibrionales bacterium]
MNTEQKTIVWLPGLLCDTSLFTDVSSALNHINHLVFDLPEEESFNALAKTILQKISTPSFTLAGLSMGGILALEIHRQAPEKIEGLILMNTNAKSETENVSEKRRQFIQDCQSQSIGKAVEKTLIPAQLCANNRDALLPLVSNMAQNVGMTKLLSHAKALENRDCYLHHLGSIMAPTLIISGKEDSICPVSNHLELFHGIPNSQLTLLSHCSHLSVLERPRLIAKHIDKWMHV